MTRTHKNRGIVSAIALMLCVFCLIAVLPTNVDAAVLVDSAKTGSLTINKYVGPDTKEPIAGCEFTLYMIATYENGEFVLNSDFASLGYTIEQISSMDTVTLKALIAQMVETVDSKGIAAAAVTPLTNKKGKTAVSGLALGWYLVRETAAPVEVEEIDVQFLISIPMTVGGTELVYDIEAFPKNYVGDTLPDDYEPSPSPSPTASAEPSPETTPSGSTSTLPKTGTEFAIEMLFIFGAVLMIVAVAAFAIAMSRRRGMKK